MKPNENASRPLLAGAANRLRIEAGSADVGRSGAQPLFMERPESVTPGPAPRAQEPENWRALGIVEPNADARLQVVAGMNPELRAELHSILGFAQLLRMNGGLDPAQSRWVDAIVAAGTKLLMQVQNAIGLMDLASEPPPVLTREEADTTSIGNIELPAERTDAGLTASRTSRLHVLVVDDVELNRDIAAAFIRRAGHVVTLCEGGDAAVAAAASADYDVILMDVRMPEIDGHEACRRIRALRGARGRVPIIALTAQTSGDQLEACRAVGMNGHLAKPFRYDTLNAAILRVTAEHTARSGAAEAKSFDWRNVQQGTVNGNSRPLKGADAPAVVSFAAAYLRSAREALSEERGVQSAAARQNGPASSNDAASGDTWIDITDPWNISSSNGPAGNHAPQRSYILDTQFDVRLTSVGSERDRQLVDARRLCEPPRDRDQYEFHWLLYTDAASNEKSSFTANCDLWRWSGSTWRSVSAAGAQFTPEEMYGHGWRYCGPCIEKTARVEVA
jgi:CheY-like chemotaxis protein